MNIEFQKLDEDAVQPHYTTYGAVGADLTSTEEFSLGPGEWELIPTGIAVAIPEGFVGLVHPRSGLALKTGITVLNAPGTIDPDYRGQLKVLLINLSTEKVTLARGARIAQLLIQSIVKVDFIEVSQLDSTERSSGGFGSTGQ